MFVGEAYFVGVLVHVHGNLVFAGIGNHTGIHLGFGRLDQATAFAVGGYDTEGAFPVAGLVGAFGNDFPRQTSVGGHVGCHFHEGVEVGMVVGIAFLILLHELCRRDLPSVEAAHQVVGVFHGVFQQHGSEGEGCGAQIVVGAAHTHVLGAGCVAHVCGIAGIESHSFGAAGECCGVGGLDVVDGSPYHAVLAAGCCHFGGFGEIFGVGDFHHELQGTSFGNVAHAVAEKLWLCVVLAECHQVELAVGEVGHGQSAGLENGLLVIGLCGRVGECVFIARRHQSRNSHHGYI